MARMISTDLRPSRPSTSGGPPASIACEEVGELVAVADVGDAARVAGAGLEAGRGLHGREDRRRRWGPRRWKSQRVMSSCSTRAEPRSPWISVRFSRPGIGARGGLDHAEGAVLEPEAGDGRVLDLDPLVGQRGGQGLDRCRRRPSATGAGRRCGSPGSSGRRRRRGPRCPASRPSRNTPASATTSRRCRPGSGGRTGPRRSPP